MDLQLEGKTALITGSSKGIGEAVAKAFAREKARVIVHGRNEQEALQVAEKIQQEGGQARTVTGDLTCDDAVDRLVRQAEQMWGKISILVNNAGGSSGDIQSWENTQPEVWMKTYDRNVLGALRMVRCLLPKMQQEKWGRVINISSLAATMPPPTSPDYSACKAAMNAMTVSLAKAVASDGVTVNTISPGTIHSVTLDSRFRDVAAQRGLAEKDAPWPEIERCVLPIFAQVPVGHVGTPEDIANAAVFLSSPLAAYITGVNLRVDGGLFPGL
ncbi:MULTISPECIES: SDR family NAD(P)-dependent oxidoreductase [Acetobacter]|uniref:3-oxoacyl-ACP reductase n=1 Tax=Acetobacter tropicalis TaxID=104102 RepID=A0A252A178_9PROT|nr:MULTISPECIES: SDR family oxidoreductase [Acetobacter]MCP1197270.1 SDR family oxidoreductase [Acetobacter senegalensis]MPQ74642.1 SDR family oxidoreductase [Acetobacter senegalensis]OUI80894.1 3-oxoacyl-ACP reductase [Acetobacter tropicalis]